MNPAPLDMTASAATLREPPPVFPMSGDMSAAADSDAFRRWWRGKQIAYRAFLADPVVDVDSPANLADEEFDALCERLDSAGMALYRGRGEPLARDGVLALGRRFGLRRAERHLGSEDDAVSEIRVHDDPLRQRYIPYSSRALNWHTDGCYNDVAHPIRAFILHCVSQGRSGGESLLLDHEILYGLLKTDPNIDVDALFAGDAFSIPANRDGDSELRPPMQGAVFAWLDGRLHARFSARQRFIAWKNDPAVLTAVEAIRYYLNHSPLVLKVRLEPGMGLVCRNVLHARGAFVDAVGSRRLVYRARYHDPIGTPARCSG